MVIGCPQISRATGGGFKDGLLCGGQCVLGKVGHVRCSFFWVVCDDHIQPLLQQGIKHKSCFSDNLLDCLMS
ncbi:MAG: hypothetical protein HW380_1229 [Magnetococcales bacterium]|nr:hypothetical protein [Magnetococcales bacterium]